MEKNHMQIRKITGIFSSHSHIYSHRTVQKKTGYLPKIEDAVGPKMVVRQALLHTQTPPDPEHVSETSHRKSGAMECM
jgi:hypothetical protein